MDRRSYFISVLFIGAFLLCFSDSKEFFREVRCYREVLNLDCGGHSFIAIHRAYFTTQQQENQTTCHHSIEHEYIEDEEPEEQNNHSYCYEDVRIPINRRCSGLKNCEFSYSEETEKKCFNTEGVLIVHFDCVRGDNLNKYCNAKITASEGYITQPGYPKFYPELKDCSWSLSATAGQTIVVKILHLHLSSATEVSPTIVDHESLYAMGIGQLTEQITHCEKDSLSILEGNMKRLSVCGESLDSLQTFEADASNDLVLKFKSTAFLPASGFLAYFKIQGCPDMGAGEDSYLVERNGTAAIYACRNDLVFNDTLENKRFLTCIRDHHWSNTLSPCIQVVEEAPTSNPISFTAIIEQQIENVTSLLTAETKVQAEPRFTEDILIPCIIIAILIVGNIFIVIIICVIRRKKKDDDDEEEEDLGQPNNSSP